MAHVVLHYGPGSAAGLGALLEQTERLLEAFPCRTPPVFSPWFPAAADRHAPIRPARPAPVIVCPAGSLVHQLQEPEMFSPIGVRRRHLENPPEPEDNGDGAAATDSPLQRSWSVFTQRGVLRTESLSKPFRHAIAVHQLHLHQRAKWVIGQHNCGRARDIEQVWRALSRCSRTAGLPTCNANIRRDRAEIWVFCDVVRSERVGRFLMEELQLSGGIKLSVHRRGNVFSL
ncbi:shieldin complex subunit 3 [Clinocottus analis]|uniref:shieldin complex subunit 3 n=1 Tax=Clinocottus analis TaxID=304258 RepID=UPI0035C1D3FD